MTGPMRSPDFDLQDRLYALIIHHTDGRRPLRDTDELFDDLGLDGDDAVDFFQAYGEAFNVDLTSLHRRWGAHFGPEGFPLSFGLGMILIGAAVGFLVALTGLPKWAAFGLGLLAAFGWLIGLRAWPLPRGEALIPITVSDLIHAARIGRWPETDKPS